MSVEHYFATIESSGPPFCSTPEEQHHIMPPKTSGKAAAKSGKAAKAVTKGDIVQRQTSSKAMSNMNSFVSVQLSLCSAALLQVMLHFIFLWYFNESPNSHIFNNYIT